MRLGADDMQRPVPALGNQSCSGYASFLGTLKLPDWCYLTSAEQVSMSVFSVGSMQGAVMAACVSIGLDSPPS